VIAVDAVLAKVRQLPALSAAVVRIGELARDEHSSAADFERAIRPDPALTANVLRIANSAHFALRCRADSVRHAVSLLGLRRVSEVAAAAGLAPVIPPRLPGYDIDAAEFWRHCVAVAVLAEHIAAALRLQRPGGVFTAALLHDMGKLAITTFVADASAEILGRSRGGVALVRAERQVLGVDHGEVGAAVAQAWRLPPAVAAAARWHHAPGETPPDVDATAIGLVHVADSLAHVLGFGADAGELARSVDPAVEARLGIRPRVLERVAADSLDEIADLASVFTPARGGNR
jgi:putative nucleotidyltransferase with HDIG domain